MQADAELKDDAPIIVNDDDFDLDGISFDPELVQRRWDDLIKWNPAAENTFKAAYTGDIGQENIENCRRNIIGIVLLRIVRKLQHFSQGRILPQSERISHCIEHCSKF